MAQSLEVLCRLGGKELILELYPTHTYDSSVNPLCKVSFNNAKAHEWCTRAYDHPGPHVDDWHVPVLVWENWDGPVYKVK